MAMAMSTVFGKTQCFTCSKETSTYYCRGCLKDFCFKHLAEHRQIIDQEFDKIDNERDQFRQRFLDHKNDPKQLSLIEEINSWEKESIEQIKQKAEECRQVLIKHINDSITKIENKLTKLTDHSRNIRQENEYNEIDLDRLKTKLTKLTKELNQESNVSIKHDVTSFIDEIFVAVPSNIEWDQNAITVAGGNGKGNRTNQLNTPRGIFIDADQTIYIADSYNHRIVEWKSSAKNGKIVAGGNGNGNGNGTNQLKFPKDLIFDKQNNSFIISDTGNRRVIRLFRENNANGQIIISDIACWGLAMDNNGYLYVSNDEKHEVRRWKIGDKDGTLVAGGNGKGDQLNQLNKPTYIFVDDDYSVYVSDTNNYRVMKWVKDAKEGIIVAGGNGFGTSLSKLSHPYGVIVDDFDQIYVADYDNDRIMRWCEGAEEGTIVIDAYNEEEEESDEFNHAVGLSFDGEGNLYVADKENHRIQKFEIDLT